jgi:acyl-CoA thioester hydrolase
MSLPTPAPAVTRVRLPLRWHDIDAFGHLNHAVYHELLEEGRVALLEPLGEAALLGFVLARIELDYRHEVRRDAGHVEVEVRVAAVGRTSVTVEHDLLLPDGTVAASGRSIMVAWDGERRAARELTADEREALGFPPS